MFKLEGNMFKCINLVYTFAVSVIDFRRICMFILTGVSACNVCSFQVFVKGGI